MDKLINQELLVKNYCRKWDDWKYVINTYWIHWPSESDLHLTKQELIEILWGFSDTVISVLDNAEKDEQDNDTLCLF